MILKGKQRSGAANLAQHLLKNENEHVEVAELRHFTSENLMGALNEIEASARPTRCKQPLYSCSFNPPETARVSTEAFFAAIDRLEKRLGLTDQPRAVVFHEKEGGRRHCHVVWSRISLDGEKLKAIPMPYDRSRMKSLSRELFLENIENGWVMPNGLMEGQKGLRSNFTLAEWQQAMRVNKDPREIKAAITECLAASDSQAAFAAALDAKGYKLAKGDRRGFVAVDMQGEVYAIARYTSTKTKEINARLGSYDALPTVADRKQEFAAQATTRFDQLRGQADKVFEKQLAQAEKLRADVVARQRDERAKLKDAHKGVSSFSVQ